MSGYDLTGQFIKDTFGKVVQIVSGSFYDGYGNPISSLPTENTLIVSASTILSNDITYVEITTADVAVTLPSAELNPNKTYFIINASTGNITIIASGSNVIGNTPSTVDSTVVVYPGDAPSIVSFNTNWRFI